MRCYKLVWFGTSRVYPYPSFVKTYLQINHINSTRTDEKQQQQTISFFKGYVVLDMLRLNNVGISMRDGAVKFQPSIYCISQTLWYLTIRAFMKYLNGPQHHLVTCKNLVKKTARVCNFLLHRHWYGTGYWNYPPKRTRSYPQALHRPSHTRHSHHAGSGVGCVYTLEGTKHSSGPAGNFARNGRRTA